MHKIPSFSSTFRPHECVLDVRERKLDLSNFTSLMISQIRIYIKSHRFEFSIVMSDEPTAQLDALLAKSNLY